MIQEKAMREGEETGAKAVYEIPLEIELQNRISVAVRAVVRATASQQPHVPAVRVGKPPREGPEYFSTREFVPTFDLVVGVVGPLCLELTAEQQAGHHNTEQACM
jgi:hypothetical protein